MWLSGTRITPFLLLICLASVLIGYQYWTGEEIFSKIVSQYHKISSSLVSKESKPKSKVLKRILFYTGFFGDVWWPVSNPAANYTKQRCGCDFDMCEITFDKKQLNKSDIVLFHGRDSMNLESAQRNRPQSQLWVYFIMENPYHHPNVAPIEKYFNLSSSYRLSSDIRVPYRFHMRRKVAISLPNVNYAKGKSRQIAWAVSNCNKPRDKLAKKLHDYGLQIDNFGGCKLPFTNHRPVSRGKAAPYHEYKFVFAAENHLCSDYVTEKYWRHAFKKNANVVPIVLGGSNYSDPELAIPGSYIDALAFRSPKELAEHLILVDKNDSLYNEYFAWKKHWTFYDEERPRGCSPFMCDMCEKLHANNWKFRKNPLTSSISGVHAECKPHEKFYNKWLIEN